ncbi:OmpH family outer membrane protein [Thiomicrorhabdus sp. 6S2-11]|uniref:OmpH family outer membrane protein n=1 Tax=Thiomicrorhabdus marina TaxID=2818442 RepID=A0ABS3Q3G7_9GAMM|nr:OmpH family outer membrane protein [Thiomicrorhabdus marina]MBO1926648.1 OmpH family outer membrane protein [Thiomicrorhabdus marina]
MFKPLFVIFAMAFSLITTQLQAAEDAPVKLGVVNVALLLEQAPQAGVATEKLKEEFAQEQKELKSLATKLDSEQKNYEKNKSVMSNTQRATKERELTMMTREIQRRRNDVQELINLRRNEELAKIQNLVNEAIQTIGEKEGFDLIMYEGIAYTNNRIDITKDVLEFLQSQSKKKRSDFNK